MRVLDWNDDEREDQYHVTNGAAIKNPQTFSEVALSSLACASCYFRWAPRHSFSVGDVLVAAGDTDQQGRLR